jgi:hypothetical protein
MKKVIIIVPLLTGGNIGTQSSINYMWRGWSSIEPMYASMFLY